MGLFDGKAKQERAENEVMQKLAACPLLDFLIDNILAADTWVQMGQSYYDSCRRTVKVEPDTFAILWKNTTTEQNADSIKECIAYSYTASGYLPLHYYETEDKKTLVSTDRVCYLWASVVRERMAAKMPDCKFGHVNEDASFEYRVPALSFKDWF